MTDDALAAAQPNNAPESFTADELAQLAADGIDPAEVLKIAGVLLYRQLGVGTEVRFEGEPGQAIIVPTDRMPGATEDDVLRFAAQYRTDLKALEERFTPEQVTEAVADLEASGIFRVLVDMAAAFIREGAFVTRADDAGDAGDVGEDDDDALPNDLTDADRRRVAERATALMHDIAAEALATTFLAGDSAAAFKAGFARDLMTEAWAWALQDAREIADELEAEAGDEMPPDAFEELLARTFREGTYTTRALLTRTDQTARAMAELVGRALQETPDLGRKLAKRAWEDIRDEDAGRRKPPAPKPSPAPTMAPGFKDGYGLVPNDQLTRGVVVALQDAADGARGWQAGPDGRPFFPFAMPGASAWSGTYYLSNEQYPTVDAAWDVVRQLDDDTADTAMVALAHWLANHRRDRSGIAYISVNDILAQRGYAKHQNGGYRPDDKRAVAKQMLALGALEVEGRNIERHEPGPGGRKRKTIIAPKGRFLVVSTREEQRELDGSPTGMTVGWYYRAGDWAASFQNDAGTHMLARMMQTVLTYDSHKDRNAKRLGRFLTWQFRVRAAERSYDQAFPVGTLLKQAGIPLPENNPARFRDRIEAALDDLQARGVIGSWRYKTQPTLPGRNWLRVWLEWSVVILPPAELIAAYDPIGRRRIGLSKPGKRSTPTPFGA